MLTLTCPIRDFGKHRFTRSDFEPSSIRLSSVETELKDLFKVSKRLSCSILIWAFNASPVDSHFLPSPSYKQKENVLPFRRPSQVGCSPPVRRRRAPGFLKGTTVCRSVYISTIRERVSPTDLPFCRTQRCAKLAKVDKERKPHDGSTGAIPFGHHQPFKSRSHS